MELRVASAGFNKGGRGDFRFFYTLLEHFCKRTPFLNCWIRRCWLYPWALHQRHRRKKFKRGNQPSRKHGVNESLKLQIFIATLIRTNLVQTNCRFIIMALLHLDVCMISNLPLELNFNVLAFKLLCPSIHTPQRRTLS